jgi:hypothetical protein
MTKRLCKYCDARPAEVPDRYSDSLRPTKRVCRDCHASLLAGDLLQVLKRFNARVTVRVPSPSEPS